MTRKHILVGGVLLLIVNVGTVSGQSSPTSVMVFGTVKRSSYSLDKVKDLLVTVKNVYRQEGIPVPDQTTYPANKRIGAGILFPLSAQFSLGGVGDYGTTSAYSLYGDIAGTVDIVSHLWTTNIGAAIRYEPIANSWISPLFQIQVGAAFINLDLKQQVADENNRTLSESYVSATGTLLSVSGDVGVVVIYDPLFLVARVGVHLAESDALDGISTLNGNTVSNGTFPVSVDLSGFDFGIDLGVSF